MMRVFVHAPDAGPGLAETINERVEANLRRYADFVREASVRLRDENGPRGGRDQACVVRVKLRGAPDICLKETRDRPLEAVGKALKRVRRLMSERINARPRIPRRKRAEPGEQAA